VRSPGLIAALLLLGVGAVDRAGARENAPRDVVEISGEVLRDKIRVLENLYDAQPGTPGQKALQARGRAAGL
jgi:hypothetical protein